jgi:superfamily II DNA or RNA helicase
MNNYYAHQDDCRFQMKQNKTGFVEMPTGTGKGEINCSHAYDVYKSKSKKIKISITVSHRIMLSQQLLQRLVSFFLDKKEQPNFRRICVHSGNQIEYGRDNIDEQIWVAAYPDDKCGSIDTLEKTIKQSIELGQDIAVSTTYHSLSKTLSVLKTLKLKADVVYLDELHRGVERDEWFTTLKNFIKLSKSTYGFTATPGKQKARIESLLGSTIYYMDSHTAISKGLICKPMWMIVDVDGNKLQHLAKGVVTAFNEHQSRMSIDAKMLLHCFDSQEIATVGDSHEIKSLIKQHPDLLVAEVSSARGARINGKELDRLEWLKILNEHKGKMIVLHIDICNSGLDVPGFTFGLWTYMSASETYATQGNGRSGRIIKEDRARLECGEISVADYSQWIKPYNVCGLLFFNDTVSEDERAFVDFILRSRDQGFNPEDIVYTGNKHGVLKSDPFASDGDLKSPYTQSRIAIAISIRLENESLKELLHSTKKLDPMNIFDQLV